MSLGTIANGWTICKTQAREHTRGRIVSTKDAKDDERRRLKGNYRATGHQVFRVACGGVIRTVYVYGGGGGRGGGATMRTNGRDDGGKGGARLIHF